MNWNTYFYNIAVAVSKNSKCYSRQIGAILVKDKSIIATGYNGPSRGIPPCDSRNIRIAKVQVYKAQQDKVCPRQALGYKSGEGLELCVAAHAETNCITNAARMGVCVKDATMYMNCEIPCKNCLALLINAGITTLYVSELKFYGDRSKYLVDEGHMKIHDYTGNTYMRYRSSL